jgi:flagellum-specific peptidoglycan hydrolase FlgJ
MRNLALISSLYSQAKAATAGTGLFPEVAVVQFILESGYKLSTLAERANNFFGIKANSSWKGRVYSGTTAEYINGQRITVKGLNQLFANRTTAIRAGANPVSLFRAYDTPVEGWKGWVNFLQTNPRYARAGVFTAKDPLEQFAALRRAGYATDPAYVEKLTKIYNTIKPALKTAGSILPVLLFFF